ncbi:MAG: ATP-binding cassette domain-containing protein [Pseudoflavonifractor sp.]
MGLQVTHVNKCYGKKTVVDDLSFTIERPGAFGFLGTNGAGKTTTIRMILGILAKDSGSIAWNGKQVKRENVNFGYLPEERGIYPKTKVAEQLLYFARLRGMEKAAAKVSMDYWCRRLEVDQYLRQPAEQLSKGNQQKVQFVSALIQNPELLVLDEPFSGLDPVNTELLKSVIEELVQKGTYIIMSSHQMASIEEFCSDLLILDGGKTILAGTLAEIKRGYGLSNLSVRSRADLSPYVAASGLKVLARFPDGYDLKPETEDGARALLSALVQAGVPVDRFELKAPSLNEIFLEKVGAAR